VTSPAALALRPLAARAVATAIADAAARWTDADFPPRVRAVAGIRERTTYTEPVVDYALDRLFGALTFAALEAAVSGELGGFGALDGFVPRRGRPDGYAAPVGRVAVVASDTTIGVALAPCVFALCAKCDVAVRDRSDALCAAFRETLCEERPQFARAFAVHVQADQDDAEWLSELARADAVVAFGGDAALRAIRAAAAPQARIIPFGHRTSAGYVARGALAGEVEAARVARGLAVDALLYDGDGCLSVHVVFVESGGAVAPARFAQLLAAAIDDVAVEFPAAAPHASGAVASFRDAAAFRAAVGQGAVFARRGAPQLLVVEPPRDEPPPLLARTVALYTVEEPAEMLAFVREHALPLEAVALAPASAELATTLADSGAARFAAVGELQRPLLEEEHGGIGLIAPFVRWVTRPASAADART
jgi:Acyl-CoA reductase (LuxC)